MHALYLFCEPRNITSGKPMAINSLTCRWVRAMPQRVHGGLRRDAAGIFPRKTKYFILGEPKKDLRIIDIYWFTFCPTSKQVKQHPCT